MLFPLPPLSLDIMRHFGCFMIAERIQMGVVLVALEFHQTAELDWFLSGESDDFVAYKLAKGEVSG